MIGYEIKSWEIRQIVRILRDLEFCDASHSGSECYSDGQNPV